jgi:uncharacterized protein YjbJ (UPF0337 family)
MRSTEHLKGLWKHRIGAVTIAWAKWAGSERLEREGRMRQRAGLVQQCHAIAREEAGILLASGLAPYQA